MRHQWTEKVKSIVRPGVFKWLHSGKKKFHCPICDYHGPFKDKLVSRHPRVVREHSKCVGCGASERHRLQWLVLDDVFSRWNPSGKAILHIAPEFCLQEKLSGLFHVYHTSDLFRDDVDFKEDVQKMSFTDASYDCVFMSRVFTSVPDMDASIREIGRILKPGGLFILSEAYIHDRTNEFGEMRGNRAREVGLDVIDLLRSQFREVDCYLSNRYDPMHQLNNCMREEGRVVDDFPELVRIPGEGYMELVAVCHA